MDSMKKILGVLVVGVSALSAGCSSNKGTDNANNGQPQFNVNTGSNGLPAAQDTTDGLYGITTSQASDLTSDKCAKWDSVPQGGGTAIMEFVIDVSSSMTNDDADPNNPGAGKKWAVFSATLPSIFNSLPSSFAAGAIYFSSNNGRCYAANRGDVGIASLSATQVTALTNSVGRAQVGGSTPTYQAWAAGLQIISNWAPGANDPPALATASKYLILITDGVPTVGQSNDCTAHNSGIAQTEYDAEIKLIHDQTLTTGVKTFVVGVVGSNDPQGATFDPLYMLSRIAVAGGTAPAGCTPVTGTPTANDVNPRGTYCHDDLSTSSNLAADLTNTLGGIANSVLSCTYAVPHPAAGQSINPAETTLVFTNGATGSASVVLQNTSATCDKGWHFTDSTNSQIEICGVTCDTLQGNAASTLKLVFGCDVGTIIN